jgi:hypothetical protein
MKRLDIWLVIMSIAVVTFCTLSFMYINFFLSMMPEPQHLHGLLI